MNLVDERVNPKYYLIWKIALLFWLCWYIPFLIVKPAYLTSSYFYFNKQNMWTWLSVPFSPMHPCCSYYQNKTKEFQSLSPHVTTFVLDFHSLLHSTRICSWDKINASTGIHNYLQPCYHIILNKININIFLAIKEFHLLPFK